jgi:hypothetical protein
VKSGHPGQVDRLVSHVDHLGRDRFYETPMYSKLFNSL